MKAGHGTFQILVAAFDVRMLSEAFFSFLVCFYCLRTKPTVCFDSKLLVRSSTPGSHSLALSLLEQKLPSIPGVFMLFKLTHSRRAGPVQRPEACKNTPGSVGLVFLNTFHLIKLRRRARSWAKPANLAGGGRCWEMGPNRREHHCPR